MVSTNNGNNNFTTFSVQLVNQAYLGTYDLNVDIYDSLNVYGKQRGTVQLRAADLNVIEYSVSQSNPYLNELSTYVFRLNFTTPNVTILQLSASTNFTISSPICLFNCGPP